MALVYTSPTGILRERTTNQTSPDEGHRETFLSALRFGRLRPRVSATPRTLQAGSHIVHFPASLRDAGDDELD